MFTNSFMAMLASTCFEGGAFRANFHFKCGQRVMSRARHEHEASIDRRRNSGSSAAREELQTRKLLQSPNENLVNLEHHGNKYSIPCHTDRIKSGGRWASRKKKKNFAPPPPDVGYLRQLAILPFSNFLWRIPVRGLPEIPKSLWIFGCSNHQPNCHRKQGKQKKNLLELRRVLCCFLEAHQENLHRPQPCLTSFGVLAAVSLAEIAVETCLASNLFPHALSSSLESTSVTIRFLIGEHPAKPPSVETSNENKTLPEKKLQLQMISPVSARSYSEDPIRVDRCVM